MSLIWDFIAGLARARTSFKEIQDYGKNLLKKTQIYEIITPVKEGKTTMEQNNRRKKVSLGFVTETTAEVESDSQTTF
jgi:hypothetical protein